ncbi:MAG: hypothetical protein HPY74_09900 [Firmicutes bacterium]|nr:hypothetical protein [Bacillota bacterium]
MNYLRERVAYLKGLVEGMQISELTNEGKLFRAIIDVMDEIALAVEDLESIQEQHKEQIDDIDRDLSEIESVIFEYKDVPEYDEEDNDEYDDDFNIDENECEEYNFEYGNQCDKECDQEIYMVECPYCFEIIELEKEMCVEGEENIVECPKCHESIDVEWINDCDE